MQSFLHHVRMICSFIQRDDEIKWVTSGKGYGRYFVCIQHIPRNDGGLKESEEKGKEKEELHSFLHIDRGEALFTGETTPCNDIEELLSPCKLYNTLITEPVISMQICDSHSKAWMFHTLCATKPSWVEKQAVRRASTYEQKLRENICFLWNHRTGKVGRDLWRYLIKPLLPRRVNYSRLL